jgi:hypothetical protein
MSLSVRGNLNTVDPFHLYYDLNIINNDTTGTKAPPTLVFNEIRNNPILMNPSEYFLSVVRFSLETPTLPVFIPQVMLGQGDINKLIYSITLKYKTFEFQQFLQFAPQDISQPLPAAPLVFQDLTSDYYFIYSYNRFIEMINQGFTAAVAGLSALAIAGGDALPSLVAPFFNIDATTNLCTMYADTTGYNEALANPISIYFNAPLFTLFNSFENIIMGYGPNILLGENNRLRVYAKNGLNTATIAGVNYLTMTQETPSLGALASPVQSLVFSTALLPVTPTLVSVPRVFNSDTNLFNVGNNSNISTTLTDFEVPITTGFEYKNSIFYSPQSEYRLIDMASNQPLQSIQLTVFWKDPFGGLHPFKLGSGCAGNLKIMFRKKAFNVAGFLI